MRSTAISALVLLGGGLYGQAPAPVRPHFDSAYVELSRPGAREEGGFMQRGQAVFVNTAMLDLIAQAYGLRPAKVLGGPDWLASDLYNLRAKAGAASSPEQMQSMLQAFLAERFSLVAHFEKRPLPAYSLVLAGKAAKLTLAAASDKPADCQAVPIVPGATPGRVARQVNCANMSMSELADQLENMAPAYIDQPVIDSTGIAGKFDFSLKWIGRGQLRNKSDAEYDPAIDLSMFDAIANLGLKLQPIQTPTTVLVVDSINKAPLVDAEHPMPPPPPAPTDFDVAVIKPAAEASQKNFIFRITPGGEVDICCFPLQFYLANAFDMDARRIINKPNWLADDHWDLRAKTVPGVNEFDVRVMLQNLVKTRFQLAYHEETRRSQVWALHAGSHPKLAPSKGGRSDCAFSAANGNRVFTCTNMTMAQFAERVWNDAPVYFDKPVVDRTGLTGAFDFSFSFAPAFATGFNGAGRAGAAVGGSAAPEAGTAAAPSGAMTIFEAVDKQLGLKFSTETQPVKVIVIDHIERTPTGN
ncbi:MAG TPA: TIGR03435 family protein [Terriglobales bacterium]